ncbi:hypothetical protein ABFS82_05G034800 [Erythranthe guttata]|uniref:Uncharacterized protein n=1 Tax=Erythranthe guttata TaxID=4155 RepID=A0A022QRV3_ERYGU|nr:PREDICTED: uncharacterized protein LOC105966148 [Erythranthe guttata]EYU29998.1 hypothetical protein MIMGU_mgv1a026725mg [Erythranthe guttata]|eukprot:XP_012846160.1 PREDICTED: uncharacterized protein LOC105966148 [Erythranthe guttata]
MAKKRSAALVQKLSVLLKIYIFLARLKKPMIRNLVSLKKTRKLKRLNLFDQYGGYVREYEFSPSSTPLIHGFRTRWAAKSGRRIGFKTMYARCLGKCLREGEDDIYCLDEILPESAAVDLCGDDEDCVDERAEIFIQRFYEEMRRQRLDSGSKINGLLLEI